MAGIFSKPPELFAFVHAVVSFAGALRRVPTIAPGSDAERGRHRPRAGDPVRFKLLGRATVPPVPGVEVAVLSASYCPAAPRQCGGVAANRRILRCSL